MDKINQACFVFPLPCLSSCSSKTQKGSPEQGVGAVLGTAAAPGLASAALVWVHGPIEGWDHLPLSTSVGKEQQEEETSLAMSAFTALSGTDPGSFSYRPQE